VNNEGKPDKAHTESLISLSKGKNGQRILRDLALMDDLVSLADEIRPKLRSICREAIRPCPFALCRYHLALEVNEKNGSIKHVFPGIGIPEMPFTCALDLADAGGMTLEEVGTFMNMTRERVRQVEETAIGKLINGFETLDLGNVPFEELDPFSKEMFKFFERERSKRKTFPSSRHGYKSSKTDVRGKSNPLVESCEEAVSLDFGDICVDEE